MGGVVKKALGSAEKQGAIEKIKEPEKTATTAETEMAKQRQASLRARRGVGGLFSRILGSSEDTLGS
jgi:hypothetical protein